MDGCGLLGVHIGRHSHDHKLKDDRHEHMGDRGSHLDVRTCHGKNDAHLGVPYVVDASCYPVAYNAQCVIGSGLFDLPILCRLLP